MKKRILGMVLAATMVMSLAACSGNKNTQETTSAQSGETAAASEEKAETGGKKVAVLFAGNNAYFAASKEGCQKAADEYGLDVTFFDGNWDAATQLNQMEDCITTGYDIIAIAATDAMGILPGIENAKEAGIPVVAFTNAVGENGWADGLVSFVGQDEEATGALCADMAEKLLDGKSGKVVCLEGVAGTFCQIHRTAGFEKEIEGKDMELVYTQACDWSKETALSTIEDLIASGLDFNVVFCQDDGMAAGAGQALKEAGKKDDVYVIGIGGSKDGMQAMRDGLIDGDTFMSAVEEGQMAVEVCAKYLNGEKIEEKTVITQVEVTLDNIDEFTPEW